MMAKKTKIEIDDQPQLPGTEDERDDVLIKAAKRYQAMIRERKEVAEREESAHNRLCELMHEKGIEQYQYKGLIILLNKTEKAKVRLAAAPEASDNGDGE